MRTGQDAHGHAVEPRNEARTHATAPASPRLPPPAARFPRPRVRPSRMREREHAK